MIQYPRYRQHRFSSFQVIIAGFAAVDLVGALLLMLPIAASEKGMPKKSAESANCRVLTERQCNMKKRSLKFLALGISAVMMMGTLGACGSSKSDSSTADGSSFVITLYPDEAPITCENFEKLVKDGFYDGLKFHRVVDGFMAQGGDPSGDGTGGSSETIKGEFSQNGVENNLSHTRGVVSMARSNDPDSASSQFFICYSDDDTFLDAQCC